MPTYTFRCPRCEQVVEEILSISEYTNRGAPACTADNEQMEIQLQVAPIHFKGSGWTPKFHKGPKR